MQPYRLSPKALKQVAATVAAFWILRKSCRCFACGKRLTRVVEVDHCFHWSYCSHCCPSIVHIGRPLDVHWTCNSIVENVQWSPMDTMDKVCPFFMTNGHVQWTQWMSIVRVHLSVHNGHTHTTSIGWRLHFGWFRPISIIGMVDTMNTIDTINGHWS